MLKLYKHTPSYTIYDLPYLSSEIFVSVALGLALLCITDILAEAYVEHPTFATIIIIFFVICAIGEFLPDPETKENFYETNNM